MGKVFCPKCEKDDQIQKVTSIVTSGNSTMQLDYRTATSTTQLAQRLSPRKAPPDVNTRNIFSLNFILIVLSVAGIGSLCLTLAIFGLDFNLTVFWIVFIVIAIAASINFSQSTKKGEKERIIWKRELSNWTELYYCHRDDCVFDPRTNKHSSPEGMSRLL